MPTHFDLIITADHPNRMAEFRLLNADGGQLAWRQTDFKTIPASRLQGLFDLRNYLRLYFEEGRQAAAAADIGVSIAEEVLGGDIFEKLWKSESQRTLRIQLPGASQEENYLAAALARVPWEIARPSPDQPTLGERNLLVRVVHDTQTPASQPMELAPGEPLRVLFVFAEARGSRPLGARQERLDLQRLFEREIYPQRRVVAHFLTHGVTRERLESQIRDNGGYHIVHWSGHGHLNLLELAKPGGQKDHISGEQLLDLFTAPDVGGFIPRFFFLSACHSGDILRVKDWADFLAIAQGKETAPKQGEGKQGDEKQLDIKQEPGFTGTAHALLQGGVPSVVAMRYAVADDYARELAVEFYRALLAHTQPKSVAAAVTLARAALQDGQKHDPSRFAVCDHATPVLYGAEQAGLMVVPGRSPALNPRNPRLHQIAELTMAEHEHFVGRTWELDGLGADFIGSSGGAEVRPVAVITGLGGMGKTTLVAEALALWDSRFEWVLLYQAKPNALGFEATLRDIDLKLRGELGRYHDHVEARPADAIYRDATAGFTGRERFERLTRNLVRAMKDEPILLVLDNFETNLKPQPEQKPGPASAAGEPVWACQDPAWTTCLGVLAAELAGSPSRVLITCRRPLSALADSASYRVRLGPLPAPEAALFLKVHPALSGMVFGADAEQSKLARRLLTTSRFHPLLMDRLGRLAADPTRRPQLLDALDRLEKSKDFSQLPALFACRPDDPKELAYLDDALATSLDQLIGTASPDTRRLLWIVALANDPVALGLLRGVWSGESHEQQQLRQIKQLMDMLPLLPPEIQAKAAAELPPMSPEFRTILDNLPPDPPARPEIEPLLRELVSVGLAAEERTGPEDANPNVTCHELVRERIRAWMAQQPPDRGEWTENAVRLAYAERLVAVFQSLQHENMASALEAGSQSVVYCVQAEAWDRLGAVAGGVVTSTSDPRLTERLIPHLRTAAESAPEGNQRWRCLCLLADAFSNGGRPDASLSFYEQAAAQARAVAHAGGDGSRRAWSDVAWITGNWANALYNVGNLPAARESLVESAEAKQKAGKPAVEVIGSELEALRIDIAEGKVAKALPQVELRLEQVADWWRRGRLGQPVPEAPNAEVLARAYISALDIARQADYAREDWKSALRRLETVLEVKHALERAAADIAVDRFNRASVLVNLGRFGEARAELEDCLEVFQGKPKERAAVLASLAGLFAEQGDVTQAITQERRALAVREQLPDPGDRAISHNNLAISLKLQGNAPALAESTRHQLAASIYRLVARLGQQLQSSLSNYAIDFRRTRGAGTEVAVPRVAELLANPAFHALELWLCQRQVDPAELQMAVDQFLEQARQAAAAR
jgi:tetratricopeptide (TPR) repeat protein